MYKDEVIAHFGRINRVRNIIEKKITELKFEEDGHNVTIKHIRLYEGGCTPQTPRGAAPPPTPAGFEPDLAIDGYADLMQIGYDNLKPETYDYLGNMGISPMLYANADMYFTFKKDVDRLLRWANGWKGENADELD